jgi:hypothetical protein
VRPKRDARDVRQHESRLHAVAGRAPRLSSSPSHRRDEWSERAHRFDDVSLGCSTNADCASAGAGTCGIDLAAANPSQNECTGGAANCVDGGDGNATCSAGPVDRFCDGLTEPNGRGLLQCASNADCNANDCNADNVATSGECGACSLEVNRSCFGPTVSATGTPGVFHAEAAAVFCVPRYGTSSPSLTNFPGYPGPGRLKVDFDIDLYCADRTTRFELPGGSNCP